ncbi:MAG: TonB-dependent receptor plug domain-containing protein, partial [Spirochaetaceae bacterium]|nr:TonB-dependent receptor plug domain-containing protein [Spirochaetaceae bacterium]
KSGETSVTLDMIIAGVIEGQELVVERSAPGQSDEESGVSLVMEAEEMDTTANIGVVEDVMSSIKTLPGVGYTGGWDAQPSIRGGDPSEMAATLDGIYVTYPYHWGGAFSIFNPNMTKSAKLSHGVFSARFGRALSGILEVNSITPDDEFRADLIVSSSSTDLFMQIPTGEYSGLFLGGKVTYLETVIYASGMEDEITTAPYIRDFYGKWETRPSNQLHFFVNGFIGTDGVGNEMSIEADGITSDLKFDYYYINAFATTGLEWSPNDKTLFRMLAGYNHNQSRADFDIGYSGSREYSDEFIAMYDIYKDDVTADGLINGQSGYDLIDYTMGGYSDWTMKQLQLRLEMDRVINENNLISFGIDEVFLLSDVVNDFSGFQSVPLDSGGWDLKESSSKLESPGNRVLHSSAFALWEIGGQNSRLQGELGIRGEHYYLWNDDKDLTLNTYPVADPRLHLSWQALKNRKAIDELTLSMGTGMFSQFPMETSSIEEEWGIEDFDMSPNRALYQIIGTEINFLDQWTFQLEGYYKYFFNRAYITGDYAEVPMDWNFRQDGYGHAVGFDLMLQRELGRKWDGYINYSFVYTRLFYPYEAQSLTDIIIFPNEAPLNQWYYPDYQRFHTANLVLNYHPLPQLTLTCAASFATGSPMMSNGEVTAYPATLNGEIIEMYNRDSMYSDSLRNEISIPVDLRVAYKFYSKRSKWEQEIYLAVEDILVNIYSPAGATQYNSFTGKEEPGGADFNIGMPIPSIGYKASY